MADAIEESVHILLADPELAESLSHAQGAQARRELVATVQRHPTGEWRPHTEGLPAAGFLVLEGCITREVVILGQTAAIDFIAAGDLVQPSADGESASVPSRVTWRILEPTRLAALDRSFLLAAQPWPQVAQGLLQRQERRARWLSNVLAVSHLPGVDLRILVLFWQFADRWGKVSGSGVTVPIPLTHLDIARLIGARRPTVTTALKALVDAGLIAQKSNRHWLLLGQPPSRVQGPQESRVQGPQEAGASSSP